MRKVIAPYIARTLFSQKRLAKKRIKLDNKRRRANLPHKVTVYLRINDAYSYVLLQVLKQLQQRYTIEYDFRTVLNLQAQMYPAPQMWQRNAFEDCVYFAGLYDDLIEFPVEQPASDVVRDRRISAQLLHWELQPDYLDNALRLFKAYWAGDEAELESLLNSSVVDSVECYQHHLTANEAMLKRNGHYLSAMLHYGNEWYWGIDRLQYLERRLNQLDAVADGNAVVNFDRSHQSFCKRLSKSEAQSLANSQVTRNPVEMFFSTRSPYSYLGLIRARVLCEHYGVKLIVKPVLPMVMRRMEVPKTKGSYIMHDVSREAEQHGLPYGFVADPLGKGVENTYALFDYAKQQGKEIDLLESVARGVWAEGIRADNEAGLSKLVNRAGLNWLEAKPHLSDESWRVWAQDNLAELYSYGQWGVPSFKFQETVVFGQDRLDRIELEIAKALTDGAK